MIMLSNSARVLISNEERAAATAKVDLFLNNEKVIAGGNISLRENYLCNVGGTPSNSVLLRELTVVDGDYCIPYVNVKYLDMVRGRLRKVIIMNFFSMDTTGKLSDDLRVRWLVTQNIQNDEFDAIYNFIMEDRSSTLTSAKAAGVRLSDAANAYNVVASRIFAGGRTKSEIEEDIKQVVEQIAQVEADLLVARQKLNDFQAECTNRDAEREEALARLRKARAKLEDLLTKIQNNKDAIALFELAINDNETALANCKKTRDAAKKECETVLAELKNILLTQKTDLEKIEKLIFEHDEESTTENVNKAINGFVNVLS